METDLGVRGMLVKGEADLSGFPITLFQKKREAVNFTFPMDVSDVTFMTTKPEPYPTHFAIFEVFNFEVLGSHILFSIFFMSLLLYFLLKRKETFSTILLENVGCQLEQSYSFQVRQRNTVLLLLHWLLEITMLTASYKAVILSVISVPRMFGIRDIKDLSKAAEEKFVMCMTYKDCATDVWFDSKDEKFQSSWECLNTSEAESLFHDEFLTYPHRKAFIATRRDISKFDRDYFLSDDSFSISHHSILHSKQFFCRKKLENVVLRIVEADLYRKLHRDFSAQLQLLKPITDDYDRTTFKSLTLTDFTGVFLIVFIGHFCALLVFIAETVVKVNYYKTFKFARNSRICSAT